MRNYACMLQTIDTTKDSFIGWWHETSFNSDFIALAKGKNRPSTAIELECDFICRCSIFHFLALLKNYDRWRLNTN